MLLQESIITKRENNTNAIKQIDRTVFIFSIFATIKHIVKRYLLVKIVFDNVIFLPYISFPAKFLFAI